MAKKSYSKFRSQWWKILEIDRQLREQLRHGRPCTVQSLREKIEVDARTIRRFIELMRDDLGSPIEYDRALQSYKYTHPNWAVPNVHLDEGEMHDLAMAVQAIRPVMPPSLSEDILSNVVDGNKSGSGFFDSILEYHPGQDIRQQCRSVESLKASFCTLAELEYHRQTGFSTSVIPGLVVA